MPSGSSRFPHLYRCGHIEGQGSAAGVDGRAGDFRIFIDAATLKDELFNRYILAASMDFRIFIDAATLKGEKFTSCDSRYRLFPHLYRCGHIEGATTETMGPS